MIYGSIKEKCLSKFFKTQYLNFFTMAKRVSEAILDQLFESLHMLRLEA